MSIKQNGGVFGRNPTFNDVTIEGQLTFEGNIDIDSDITWEDGKKALFGDSGDLEIYHSGSHSFITENGTGDLRLSANNLLLRSDDAFVQSEDGSLAAARFNSTTGVTLYRAGSPKLSTTSTGVDVTGDVSIGDGSASSTRLVMGAGDDSKMFHNGADTYWMNDTGNIIIRNQSDDKDILLQTDDGAGGFTDYITVDGSETDVSLHFGGNAKLTTTTSGCDITGTATMDALDVSPGGAKLNSNSAEGLQLGGDAASSTHIGNLKNTSGRLTLQSASGRTLAIQTNGANDAITVDGSQNVSIPNGDFKIHPNNSTRGLTITSTTTGTAGDTTTYDTVAAGFGRHVFKTDGTEAMRIDSSQNVSIPNGNLLVGTSSTDGDGLSVKVRASGGATTTQLYFDRANTTTTGFVAVFANNSVTAGSISHDHNSTAFNTSSDYRLKEDWQPMSGATDRLKELKPVNFAWKANGSRVDGFLAHEAQEVVPESVTGSKDAMMTEEYEVSPATGDIYTPEVVAVEGVEAVDYVAPQDEVLDEEGNVVTEAVAEVMAVEAVEAVEGVAEVIHSANVEQPSELEEGQLWRETTAQVMGEREVPDYQGIDQAKLVPLLVATIQELEARITALES